MIDFDQLQPGMIVPCTKEEFVLLSKFNEAKGNLHDAQVQLEEAKAQIARLKKMLNEIVGDGI